MPDLNVLLHVRIDSFLERPVAFPYTARCKLLRLRLASCDDFAFAAAAVIDANEKIGFPKATDCRRLRIRRALDAITDVWYYPAGERAAIFSFV